MRLLAAIIGIVRTAGAVFLLGTVAAGLLLLLWASRDPDIARRLKDIGKAAEGRRLMTEDEVAGYYERRTADLGGDSRALLATRRRLEREWDAQILREETWNSQRAQITREFAAARDELAGGLAELDERARAFDKRVEEDDAIRASAGFQRNLQLLSKVDAEIGADLIWYWPEEMAVRYLQELGSRQASELVTSLVEKAQNVQAGARESDEERKRASRLLQTLEKTGFIPKGAQRP